MEPQEPVASRSSALRCGLGLALALSLAAATVVHAADVYLPRFDRDLERRSVSKDYTTESARNLVRLLDAELEENARSMSRARSEHEKARIEVLSQILESAISRARLAAEDKTPGEASPGYEAYVQAKRIYYAYESEITPVNKKGFFETIRIVVRALFRFRHSVPNVNAREARMPVGRAQAAKEATRLVDTEGRKVTRERMATMTHEEIADLDVSEGDLTFYTVSALAGMKGRGIDPWQHLEHTIEAGVTAKAGGEFAYSLDAARRVLFFENGETSATAPKINTTDAYGKQWRVKWGNAVQTESIANRLYVRMGGKYNDIVYANGPRTTKDLVLVLADPAMSDATRQKMMSENHLECLPRSVKELKDCLMKAYKYDLGSVINTAGVIAPENIDDVLAQLPDSTKEGRRRRELMGRPYVTFKESLVEFRDPDGVGRVGTNALSSTHALEDRAIRASLLFHMWINNVDAKDANNTTALLGDGTVAESPQDLGGSLGSFLGSFGDVNRLKTGEKFLRVRRRGGKFIFRGRVLYKPRAWKAATFADGIWMARKIASLSEREIADSVGASGWPEFMQEALVYKLIERRNAIARAFRVSSPMPAHPADYAVGLRPEDLPETAARTGLSVSSVESALDAARRTQGHVPVEDHLVVDGQINKCYRTVLLGVMEEELHPSGLSRRVRRLTDDKPLPRCRLGEKPKCRLPF